MGVEGVRKQMGEMKQGPAVVKSGTATTRPSRRNTKGDDDTMTPRLLTVEQTAKLLSISPVTIYCQIGRKAKKRFPIKPIRIGGSIRFDMMDIEAFIIMQKGQEDE